MVTGPGGQLHIAQFSDISFVKSVDMFWPLLCLMNSNENITCVYDFTQHSARKPLGMGIINRYFDILPCRE